MAASLSNRKFHVASEIKNMVAFHDDRTSHRLRHRRVYKFFLCIPILLGTILNQHSTFAYSGLQSGQRIASLSQFQNENVLQNTGAKGKSLLDLPSVEQWAHSRNLKEHHLKTLYRVIFRQSFSEQPAALSLQLHEALLVNSFPKVDTLALLEEFQLCQSSVKHVEPSNRGYKLVIELANGQCIETVLIRHDGRQKKDVDTSNIDSRGGDELYTVCVSSQVGCARACTFCATGTMGLLGQLESGEILEQVYLARNFLENNGNVGSNTGTSKKSIRNVVFMGMGEPMDNYAAVHEACRGLTHQCLFGLKGRHVTISTVGATPARIRALADDAPDVCLALSLHGATGELREELIPSSRALGRQHGGDAGLEELGKALDYHRAKTGRGAMIEYLLIDGINDGEEAAHALGRFCVARRKHDAHVEGGKNIGSYVNLIPYNPTIAGAHFGYEAPSRDEIDRFASILRGKYDVRALVRWSSADGQDANGACGQLALKVNSTKGTSGQQKE
jgi:adenine C2-methylase RlmN of 23S rRNA A2503 and tRNA A37